MENEPGRQCVIPLHRPSKKELIFFFASGILVSIPFAYFFESLVPAGFSSTLLIVLLAPFIEELAKVFPLFYRHGETERSIVTLGLLIGLGFGVAEFAEYVFLGGASVIGSIPHIIFHASSATITAFGIAKKNPLPYYLFAVTFHMAINFLGLSGDILLGLFGQLLVLIIVYLFAWQYYHRASKVKVVI
jgi:RsiW-degrading membrane proteinase PrsW (M82 family)